MRRLVRFLLLSRCTPSHYSVRAPPHTQELPSFLLAFWLLPTEKSITVQTMKLTWNSSPRSSLHRSIKTKATMIFLAADRGIPEKKRPNRLGRSEGVQYLQFLVFHSFSSNTHTTNIHKRAYAHTLQQIIWQSIEIMAENRRFDL